MSRPGPARSWSLMHTSLERYHARACWPLSPHIDFPRLLNLYRDGKLKLDELITRRFELEDVNEAFEVLRRGEVARSVLNLESVA